MTTPESEIVIDYYSDVLCVWAWIAQPRLDELSAQWGERIRINHHYMDVFGDAHGKITRQWGEQDGFTRFGEHVRHAAEPHQHTRIHEDLWQTVKPRSSAPAHLLLRAAACAGFGNLPALAQHLREAFFCEGRDIARREVLLEIAVAAGCERQALAGALDDGSAMAALCADYRQATEAGVKGSPTWILNSGRQVLYGNVGYRILHANIEELLRHPGEEASWC